MSHAHSSASEAAAAPLSSGSDVPSGSSAAAVASHEPAAVASPPSAAQANEQHSTVRSAGVIASTTMLSRILGLLRDVGAAALFGTGWVWDAFVLAFLLPNLFRRLFGEGSLAAAFVPVYTKLCETHGKDAAARLVSNALGTLVLFLAALTVAFVALLLALPEGAWTLLFGASDTGGQKLELFRTLVPVLMPFVVLVCATALLGAALNVHGNFFVPAFAPVLLNLVWLAGIGVAVLGIPASRPELQCLVVAGAILLGGALGLGHHLLAIRRALGQGASRASLETLVDPRDKRLHEIGRRMGPAIVGLGVLQISVLLDSLIAELFVPGSGAVSALYFGNRVMQLPLALLGVAMAVAIFPVLARHASHEDHASLATALANGTRLTLFLSVPACLGLIVLAGPIIATVYGWGAFDAEAHARTTLVLGCYAVGLVAASLKMLQTRAFYALEDTRTPSWIAVRLVALNVVLNLLLVHTPLREAGLALSTSLVSWLGFLWLERRLANKLTTGRPAGLPLASLGRSLLASGLMAAVALLVANGLVSESAQWQQLSLLVRVGALTAVIVAAGITFLAVAAALRSPELRHLYESLRRRAARTG